MKMKLVILVSIGILPIHASGSGDWSGWDWYLIENDSTMAGHDGEDGDITQDDQTSGAPIKLENDTKPNNEMPPRSLSAQPEPKQ